MIALLTFIYIDNRYYCETQLADEIKLKKQLQDIKYESLTISAELMQLSRQSNVEKMIRDRGVDIEATTTPPIVINDSLAGKHACYYRLDGSYRVPRRLYKGFP